MPEGSGFGYQVVRSQVESDGKFGASAPEFSES
jgi:hypothetical protein